MKKVILGMVAMASMAMVSCTQDEEQLGMTDMSGIKFTGSIEEVMSRTSMNNDGKVIWCETDPISIFMRNGHHYKYQSTTGGSVSTTFTYANWYSKGNATLDQNYAVYPYAEGNTIDASTKKITVDLSGLAEQTYTENSFEEGISVMTAKSTNTDLPFFNALSMLLVRLNSDVPEAYTIKSIKIESSSLALNGTGATIDMNASDGKPVAVLTSGNKINTLDCGDGVVISTDPTDFFILVPANSVPAGDFTITITATDEFTGEEYTKIETIASAFEFKRSIYTIYERTLTSESWTGSIEADTWDGEEGEAWGDDKLTADVIEIASAQDLANFAATVNGGNSLSGKTVKLTGNIDLANQPWTPIGKGFGGTGSQKFSGTFDGNNFSIINLNITEAVNETAGLFGWVDGTIQNLTIDGVNINVNNPGEGGVGAVVGVLYSESVTPKVKGVTVKNVVINATRRIGGIVGYNDGSIEGCTVEKVKLTATPNNSNGTYDNGDKVGGIAGFTNADNNLSITENTVLDIEITGYRDLGGILGAGYGTTTKNNVTNATIQLKGVDGSYDKNTASGNASAIVGSSLGSAVVSENTSSNVTIKTNASSDTELASAINAGVTEIYLTGSNEIKMPNSSTSNSIKIVGDGTATIDVTVGAYLDNATLTFEKVNFKTSTGYVYYGDTKGSDYAALYSPNITYKECTFSGPMRIGRDGAKFEGCTFNDLGNDYVWTYGNACTFTGCTFNTEGKAILIYSDGKYGPADKTSPEVSITNCIFNATKGAKAGAIANQNCAAIEIHNYGYGVTLKTEGNTIDNDFSGEWRIKDYIAGGDKVYVNETEYTSIAIDGKTMTIDSNKNVTVNE